VRRRSEKYVIEGSKYAHWIGLYLRLHLNWVLGPFVHGRLQNLQPSQVTFAHVITPLIRCVPAPLFYIPNSSRARPNLRMVLHFLSSGTPWMAEPSCYL